MMISASCGVYGRADAALDHTVDETCHDSLGEDDSR